MNARTDDDIGAVYMRLAERIATGFVLFLVAGVATHTLTHHEHIEEHTEGRFRSGGRF